jgi:hypothetical protein
VGLRPGLGFDIWALVEEGDVAWLVKYDSSRVDLDVLETEIKVGWK